MKFAKILAVAAVIWACGAIGVVGTKSAADFTFGLYSLFVSPIANAQEAESAQPATSSAAIYKVGDTGANLREGHSADSSVVAQVKPGELLIEIKSHRGWKYVEIASSGVRGWVWDSLIVYVEGGAVTQSDADTSQNTDEKSDGEAQAEQSNAGTAETSGIESEASGQDSEETSSVASNNDSDNFDGESDKPVEVKKKQVEIAVQQKPKGDFTGIKAGANAGSDLIALITAEKVNVRAEPNLRSKVLMQVDTYQKVYIVEERKPWYYVSVPKFGVKGWVFGDFVQPLDYVMITGDDVNLREKPSQGSKVIMKLGKGMKFVKKGWQDNFVLVASPEKGYTGWVHQRYTQVVKSEPPPSYYISGHSVNFRKDPSITSDIHTQLELGTKVAVLGREEKWTLVKIGSRTGFVYSEFVTPEKDWEKSGGIRGATRNLGNDLISRALALRGTPYKWSGESIKGFDCSGFIYYLIQTETGRNDLPRSSADMFVSLGVAIDIEDIQPGDLVFFTTYKKGPSHVGLYLGDGDFVHASSAQGQVTISNMSEGYYKERFLGARRVPKDAFKR